MPEASVRFKRILYHFCLPGKNLNEIKTGPGSPSSVTTRPPKELLDNAICFCCPVIQTLTKFSLEMCCVLIVFILFRRKPEAVQGKFRNNSYVPLSSYCLFASGKKLKQKQGTWNRQKVVPHSAKEMLHPVCFSYGVRSSNIWRMGSIFWEIALDKKKIDTAFPSAQKILSCHLQPVSLA